MQRFVLCLLTGLVFRLGFAQVNQYYSHHENWYSHVFSSTLPLPWAEKVWFTNDTLLNGRILYKGFVYGVAYGTSYGSLNEPLFLARDSNQVAYIYAIDTLTNEITDTTEIDFGRSDSLFCSPFTFLQYNPVIDHIDTFNFYGIPRKLYYSTNQTGMAIEGAFISPWGIVAHSPFLEGQYGLSTLSMLGCYGIEDSICNIDYSLGIVFRDMGVCNRPFLSFQSEEDPPCIFGPNPTTGIVYMYNITQQYDFMYIQNIFGQTVPFIRKDNMLDISSLTGGIYFIQLLYKNQRYSVKIIKE